MELRVGAAGAEAGARLPAPHEEALYRLVQEALANVVKHARATRAVVTLVRDATVRLLVEDDGVGFGAPRGGFQLRAGRYARARRGAVRRAAAGDPARRRGAGAYSSACASATRSAIQPSGAAVAILQSRKQGAARSWWAIAMKEKDFAMLDTAPPTQKPTAVGWQNSAILALVSLVQLMVVVDASIVNVALPAIERALHFSRVDLQWVINAYTLIFAGFLLLGGRAADLLGRRAVLMAGVALFAGASLVCGFAPSSLMLEVSRGVQGLGGAIIAPAALSILLVTLAEGTARNRALAVWGAVAGGGGAVGVILGGLLTQGPGWRWIFFVNVPLGVLVLLAAPRILLESHGADRSRSYDMPGAVTVTLALVLLVDALVGTTSYGWGSARTIGELLGAVALLGIFLAIEGRFAADPLSHSASFDRGRSMDRTWSHCCSAWRCSRRSTS